MEQTKAPAAKGAFFIRGQNLWSKKDMIRAAVGMVGFFIGRASFFGVINPAAAAFITCFVGSGPQFYCAVLFVFAGLATKLRGLELIKYVCLIGALTAAHLIITKKKFRPGIARRAVMASAAALLCGAGACLAGGLGLYFLLMAVLEGVLVFCLTFFLKRAVRVFTQGRRRVLAAEDVAGAAVMCGLIVAGAADIYIGSVSLRVFLAALVVLSAGFMAGCAFGAMAGLLLGLMLYFTRYMDIGTVNLLATSGIFAGLVRRHGKLPAMATFLVGGTGMTLIMQRAPPDLEWLVSSLSGAVVFLLMPYDFNFKVSSSPNAAMENAGDYIERVRKLTVRRLTDFSEMFENLGKTIRGLSEKREVRANTVVAGTFDRPYSSEEAGKLIDTLADKVCAGCDRKKFCWQHNFYDTYEAAFALLSVLERRGNAAAEDLPGKFQCLNAEKFAAGANELFGIYKLERKWRNQLMEAREVAVQQLSGVGEMVGRLAEEIEPCINFHEDIEERLLNGLERAGIHVESVVVFSDRNGRYAADINRCGEQCVTRGDMNARVCAKIAGVMSGLVGKKMRPAHEYGCRRAGGRCELEITEEQRFKILCGISSVKKIGSEKSGDSFTNMQMRDGKYLLALSDGMGSGAKAQRESGTVIELLENFMEVGFNVELAVKIINSVLTLKSGDESFQTLDICVVDLYGGTAEFNKIGAAASFLLRGSEVHIIKSSGLPIGILSAITPEVSTKKVESGDYILMVTDGVLDAGGGSEWLADALGGYKAARSGTSSPHELADFVLDEAVRRAGGNVRDDMTALAARVR
ncbi:MAG: stage II sporulation protein E [Clostridiales bacterium]|jgi:stage II sporulation protein E|nr:stage II sporulation protein E [Clostridiales bacterium]